MLINKDIDEPYNEEHIFEVNLQRRKLFFFSFKKHDYRIHRDGQ
jgi:hypothetical protein